MARLQKENRKEKVRRRLEQLLDLQSANKEDPFLKFAIAQELNRAGNREAACDWYEKLIAEDPSYLGTYYHFGKLLVESGDLNRARQLYEKGILLANEQLAANDLRELQAALNDLELILDE